ncbi:MAG: hypothetical protein GKR96_01325 [Gammaproteobacteria bacterium]|nr:hypothetical protein [Gammaproteobacteria bacterium]
MTEPTRLDNARVLIYSHDTFGLGHLRRCRAIAHELVGRYKGISVLILSGSPVIGSFEFRARVDFVRIPGVIKLKDGRYTSLGLHINLDQTMAIREAIILKTAEVFDPDLFIVDKEPLGLEGEVRETLKMLQTKGVKTVLGERDIIDESRSLQREWGMKAALPALKDLYDEIWVYGLKSFYEPFQGLGLESDIYDKTFFTGYLKRSSIDDCVKPDIEEPYILVTPGGGKDGEEMVELVFEAYQKSKELSTAVIFILGPFMSEDKREYFKLLAESIDLFTVFDYHNRMESLIENAQGLVTMGGYNTFCEILSFNKPTIIIPRFEPRTEQLIRARRATELSLVTMLEPENFNSESLIPLIKGLSSQPKPHDNLLPGMLDGMDQVCERVVALMISTVQDAS